MHYLSRESAIGKCAKDQVFRELPPCRPRPTRSSVLTCGLEPAGARKGKECRPMPDPRTRGTRSTRRQGDRPRSAEAALAEKAAYGHASSPSRNWPRHGLGTWRPSRPRHGGADAILPPKVESADMVACHRRAGCRSAPTSLRLVFVGGPRPASARRGDRRSPRVAASSWAPPTSQGLTGATASRLPMLPSLGICLLAARAAGIAIVDGVHLDIADEGASRLLQQGRDSRLDGKDPHPSKQIQPPTTPSDRGGCRGARPPQIEATSGVREGKGVALLDGMLVENLRRRGQASGRWRRRFAGQRWLRKGNEGKMIFPEPQRGTLRRCMPEAHGATSRRDGPAQRAASALKVCGGRLGKSFPPHPFPSDQPVNPASRRVVSKPLTSCGGSIQMSPFLPDSESML